MLRPNLSSRAGSAGRVAGSAYARVLSPHLAALLTDHVTILFLEFELGSRLAEEIVSRTSPE